MKPYLVGNPGNPHASDHIFGWEAAKAVEKAGREVADLLGADADELIFTSGATEANNLALLGLGRRAASGERRRILVGATEHKCVIAAARALAEQHNFVVESVPVDSNGYVDLESFEEQLNEDVLIACFMAANNEIGTLQDIPSIYWLTQKVGALLHCDAAQAPLAADMSEIWPHVDFLSLSAHKIYGPMGVGGLFIKRELQRLIEPLFYGGGQQNGLRSGTIPVPLCVGMGAAANLLQNSKAADERLHVAALRDKFVDALMSSPWTVSLNGPSLSHRHPANANIRFEGFQANEVLGTMQPKLSASTGSACTTGMPEPSHVLRAIGLSEVEAGESIRFSLGRFTTAEDVEAALEIIEASLNRLKDAYPINKLA